MPETQNLFQFIKKINPLDVLFTLFSFALPLYQKIIPPFVILIVVIWLLLLIRTQTFRFQFNIPGLLFVLFYVWHALSILWSNDTSFAMFDLTMKVSFVIFPLIAFVRIQKYDLKFNEQWLMAFVAGNVISVLISVSVAFWSVIFDNASFKAFFYDRFALFHHPAYMALYLNFALIVVLFLHKKNKIPGWIAAPVSFLLLTGITLTLARMAIITAVFIIIGYLLFSIRHYSVGQIIISTLLLLITLGIVYIASQRFERFQWKHYKHFIRNDNSQDYQSFDTRYYTFKAALNVFKQNWLVGCGVGDFHLHMREQYQSMHFEKGIQQRLNAHNQFLQTAATLGITGLIILLAIFATLIAIALKHHQPILLMFSFIVMLALLTESILEKQSGIVFFAFLGNFLSTYSSSTPTRYS